MEVEVGVVPARDSVQGARYEALGVARLACCVPELSKSILEIVPGAYGGAKKALHFLPACASESMERVVEAARAELEVRRAERRSAGAEGAPSASPKAAPPEPTLLDATSRASGEIADFFRRLTAVLAPSIAGNRRMLATALTNAHALPCVLQNVVRQRSAWGATWNDLTRPENVEWAVHDGTMRAPAYALAMCKGHSWEYVDKASVYSTILVRLVMDAVEETADGLDDVSRRTLLENICVHFNEASRQQGQPSRLLIARGGARSLKFDLDPADIDRQYGGAKKRVTKRQAESGVALERSKRALQRFE